jgi:hypothetical protein
LPAREVARLLLGEVVDLEELQGLPDRLSQLGFLLDHAVSERRQHRPVECLTLLLLGGEHQVFEDGHLGQLAGDLERSDEPAFGDGMRREPRDVLTVKVDRAGGWLVDPSDAVERRRLPRAVRPDQPRQRLVGDRKRRAVDGGDTPELLAEVLDAER